MAAWLMNLGWAAGPDSGGEVDPSTLGSLPALDFFKKYDPRLLRRIRNRRYRYLRGTA